MMEHLGKYLIIIGCIIVAAGIIIYVKDSIPLLKHLGSLPGDIKIQKKNFTFYFPVMTSIVVSIILTLLFYIIGKSK